MKNNFIDPSKFNVEALNASTLPSTSVDTLDHVVSIMEVLTDWLVNSGVGYNDFSTAIRPLFYNAAIKELEKIQQKKTDSSLSILSGIDRRDIRSFRQQNNVHKPLPITKYDSTISVPARVITLWLYLKLPYKIPFSQNENSFENLVREISSEKHPRSILLELKRLGLVSEESESVILNTHSFTPSPESNEIKSLFVSNIRDHLSSGIKNITYKQDNFLEQAIFADELTEKSINILRELSNSLWADFSKKILSAALECCKEDEGRVDANKRFKLGVYQFDDLSE
jgi:hypothetical protein